MELLHFSYHGHWKNTMKCVLWRRPKWIVTPAMKLSWLQAKRENPGLLFFYKLPQVPTLIKSRVCMAHNFLTTKSHPRSIIQLDHPFWRLQTTRLTSKNLFKYLKKRLRSEVRSQALPYQICPIVIATRTRASKKLHITTREFVFSLMARWIRSRTW